MCVCVCGQVKFTFIYYYLDLFSNIIIILIYLSIMISDISILRSSLLLENRNVIEINICNLSISLNKLLI